MLAEFTESQKLEPIHISLFRRHLAQMLRWYFCNRKPRTEEREEDRAWTMFTIQLSERMSKWLAVSGVLGGRRRTTSRFPRWSIHEASWKGMVHGSTYFWDRSVLFAFKTTRYLGLTLLRGKFHDKLSSFRSFVLSLARVLSATFFACSNIVSGLFVSTRPDATSMVWEHIAPGLATRWARIRGRSLDTTLSGHAFDPALGFVAHSMKFEELDRLLWSVLLKWMYHKSAEH